jgi:hypothetical protein
VSLTNRVLVMSLNGPSATVIEGATNGMRCAYVENGSTLSGFTLRNGTALGDGPLGTGGGVLSDSFGVVTNCVLLNNSAQNHGGGADSTVLYNCTLSGNSASINGGGAVASTLHHCTLTNNLSGNNGGGADSSTLYNCVLIGNSAPSDGGWGGGASFSTLYSCLIAGNSAGQEGGGAFAGTLYNCTLALNSAVVSGGGVYADTNFPGSLTNCIVVFNRAPDGANYLPGPAFAYSCTTPLLSGPGNIDADPLFVNAAVGDFHLRSDSPCIDVGTNLSALLTTDLDGQPRPLDGSGGGVAAFDIGAYEFNGAKLLPRFIQVRQSAGALSLQWNDAAKGMKLQRATTLTHPVWQDVPGSAAVNSITIPLGRGPEYYRLVLP